MGAGYLRHFVGRNLRLRVVSLRHVIDTLSVSRDKHGTTSRAFRPRRVLFLARVQNDRSVMT